MTITSKKKISNLKEKVIFFIILILIGNFQLRPEEKQFIDFLLEKFSPCVDIQSSIKIIDFECEIHILSFQDLATQVLLRRVVKLGIT